MQPVSSVTAFVARYAERPADDPVAAEILSALDPDTRLVLEAQAVTPGERRTWLQQRTARRWTEAWLLYVERQAFVALRRELQRRGLLH